jgi:hypothetical protein
MFQALSEITVGTRAASTCHGRLIDDESTVTNQTGCALQTVISDTNGVTFNCSATSAGGSDSQSVTIKRDATAPTLAPTVTPNPVIVERFGNGGERDGQIIRHCFRILHGG